MVGSDQLVIQCDALQCCETGCPDRTHEVLPVDLFRVPQLMNIISLNFGQFNVWLFSSVQLWHLVGLNVPSFS